MPLYAGVCETNITPPIGVWMSGYAARPTPAVAIHDELYARALVLDDGRQRIALLAADVIAFDASTTKQVREQVALEIGTVPEAVMLHATHTHGGPYIGTYRGMGPSDPAYLDILLRKLIGAAKQARENLMPAHLIYGESAAQIGVNRRSTRQDGRTELGANYGGPVAPLVQTLCVNGADGRTFAMLFAHACHPTTMTGDNLSITADWPGAACAHLKERFRLESKDTGIAATALPFALQGCCGDINPIRRNSWEAVAENGRAIADAAHTARWNAHGRLDATLDADEITVELPLLPPPSAEECDRRIAEWESLLVQAKASHASPGRLFFLQGRLDWARDARRVALDAEALYSQRAEFEAIQPFSVQRLTLGGVHLLGFPAEMFVRYQQDFSAQSRAPVMSLGYTNGCWNYVPTAAEYARGGYEVEDAHAYYGTLMFTPECEPILRDAAYALLDLDDPDTTPYPL